jgi:L-amino acid N-acyltransferase YncA
MREPAEYAETRDVLSDDVVIRPAGLPDAATVAAIYNEGIEGREATFQTELQRAADFEGPIVRREEYPFLVAERGNSVIAWAATKAYSDFPPYRPVAECMLYVTASERRRGIGKWLLNALAEAAEEAGFTKLIGKIFTGNERSVALVRRCGFREVGVHLRHGRLDGEWRDVLLVERPLGEAVPR